MRIVSTSLAILLSNLITSSESFGFQTTYTRILNPQNHHYHPHASQHQSKRNRNISVGNSATESPPSSNSSAKEESDGLTVGDTKGAALVFDNVAISRGANRIISNVNFRVERNQRWGIVGPNGAGKSTLLVRRM